MSLNAETKFSEVPHVDKPRSTFDRSFKHQTTANASDLIPICWDECLPGDTFTVDFSHLTRMTTPIAPVMDNCWMDVYAFFVPTRLLWVHWKEFWGENNVTYWDQPVTYVTPKLTFDNGSMQQINEGSLLNYLGLPVGYKPAFTRNDEKLCAFPLRGYCKIWNDWFRDENLQEPIIENKGDQSDVVLQNWSYNVATYASDIAKGAYCAKVAKAHDYFTSALPAPMKNTQPINLFGNDNMAPVITGTNIAGTDLTKTPLRWVGEQNHNLYPGSASSMRAMHASQDGNNEYHTTLGSSGFTYAGSDVIPGNLWADLSKATVSTISQLRTAFAIQRYFEACARGGTRYTEWLENIFSVTSPDYRLQRSEFLGSRRFRINMDQVLQTSSTDSVSPQGNTAAFSCTANSDNLCTYSTTEHGYFYILCAIRQEHSYAQGISKQWLRDSWEDYYIPQFAHLSEMPILNREIYAQGSDTDDEVFGYQEAWAEYRYKPSMVTGKCSPQASGSLSIWNYTDYYTQLPQLSGEWISETEDNIKRTLAVQNEPQFIIDAYIGMKWTRVMPLYSVPGLMDHF